MSMGRLRINKSIQEKNILQDRSTHDKLQSKNDFEALFSSIVWFHNFLGIQNFTIRHFFASERNLSLEDLFFEVDQ